MKKFFTPSFTAANMYCRAAYTIEQLIFHDPFFQVEKWNSIYLTCMISQTYIANRKNWQLVNMIGFKSRVAFNGTRTVENSWIQLELYDLSVLCSSTHSSLAMPAVLLLLCSAQSSAVPHNVRFCLKTLKKYSIYTM